MYKLKGSRQSLIFIISLAPVLHYNRIMEKIDRSWIRTIRYIVQWAILALIAYGGYVLWLFYKHFTTPNAPLVERAPLVDGFLPIGGLISLKLWLTTGHFDPIHPAALTILLSAIIVSVVFKKGFCGWICPVGTISEAVYKIGKRIFGRNITLHPYIDYPLRSLKYILMLAFVYVAVSMSPAGIQAFLDEPYWKVSDIKMLVFFIDMSQLTIIVLAVLLLLSLPIKNFWCRYLCPYGALLGLGSVMSPFKITRVESACIGCMKCTKNCPASLPVDSKYRIKSPECTGCLTCVSVCPARGALDISLTKKRKINPFVYLVLVVAVFFGIIGIAKLTGHWHSNVSYEDYKTILPYIHTLNHP